MARGGGATNLVKEQVLAPLTEDAWPCVMGKSVLEEGRFVFEHYDELGRRDCAVATLAAIAQFSRQYPPTGKTNRFASFIATFASPHVADELEFESLLWRHLQFMHEGDDVAWNAEVSSDPQSPKFSFSIAGRAFYVIGMHPKAWRLARRVPVTTLVFNPHDQFEALRSAKVYQRVKATIREKDTKLQGSTNPTLEDHGVISEARQYSGRNVEAGWRCPFHPVSRSDAAE